MAFIHFRHFVFCFSVALLSPKNLVLVFYYVLENTSSQFQSRRLSMDKTFSRLSFSCVAFYRRRWLEIESAQLLSFRTMCICRCERFVSGFERTKNTATTSSPIWKTSCENKLSYEWTVRMVDTLDERTTT